MIKNRYSNCGLMVLAARQLVLPHETCWFKYFHAKELEDAVQAIVEALETTYASA